MSGGIRLRAILEAMNADLRHGEYRRMEDYSAELETILADPGLSEAWREESRRLALRNMDCLKAAQAGLRAGLRRLAEFDAAERACTYDSFGRRQPLTGGSEGRRL